MTKHDTPPKTRKQLIIQWEKFPKEIKEYFKEDLELIEKNFSYDIVIVHMFSRVEAAYNTALYCGVVKRYKVQIKIASKIIDAYQMNYDDFPKKYKAIFDNELSDDIQKIILDAKTVRNKIAHGKTLGIPEPKPKEKVKTIFDILKYAEAFNECVAKIEGVRFTPFGRMQGFKGGRTKSLSASTSRWVLRGMGFPVS